MHHGTIWVESQVGKGATFSLILPARVRPTQAAAAKRDAEAIMLGARQLVDSG
jgi:chemotaxis protein histidine kinase CheA